MASEEPVMETTTLENSESTILSTSDVDNQSQNVVPQVSNHESESKDVEPKYDISTEEVTSIMEVIATTGRFWHDWDMLKSILSFRLKQVCGEYPEYKMVSGDGAQQNSFSGDTYPELVKQLDEVLLSFMEGPPFTLQRLCEILLNPKGTYRSLSKLALALEKNLLVTSTLTICTDPYPTALVPKPEEGNKPSEEPESCADVVPHNVETLAGGDADEEMAEADTEEGLMNADAVMGDEKASEATDDKTFMETGSEKANEATKNKSHMEMGDEKASNATEDKSFMEMGDEKASNATEDKSLLNTDSEPSRSPAVSE